MINCQFENGNKASLRHVVVDVIVLQDNNILLVKRASHLLEAGKYALVGGFVERDETTTEAAIREVLEETGYKIRIDKLLFVNDNPNRPHEDRQNISFVYVGTALEKLAEPDSESTDVRWFDLNSLPDPSEIAFDHYENIKKYLKS